MKLRFSLPACAAFMFLFSSCKKDLIVDQQEPQKMATFPSNEKAINRVAVNRDVFALLKVVYKEKRALNEVKAAILSGFYEDERVLLKDLLYPEHSELYKSQSFKKFGVEAGVFKKLFLEELDKGEYKNIKAALNSNSQRAVNSTTGFSEAPDPD
ncbi:MAG TPA: hypothetical protein VM368_05560 [Flavisolibacter sp.]|nr:hypothetical protein [Flavisolibacter sp.]